MPDVLAAIGFLNRTPEDLQRYAAQTIEQGKPQRIAHGNLYRWEAGGGAELWVYLDDNGAPMAVAPHFNGAAGLRVALTSRIQSADGTALDAAYYGWTGPIEMQGDTVTGAYPFVFDMPDAARHANLPLPAVQRIQLVAFAYGLEVLPGRTSLRAWLAAHEHLPQMDVGTFLPTGLFAEDDATDPVPTAEGFFTGTVLETRPRVNYATGKMFQWARVATMGGEIDVVAAGPSVNERIQVDDVVYGSAWLSGRIMS